MRFVDEMMAFIRKSPTAYQVVENLSVQLEAAGFQRLNEGEIWRLQAGGNYYVTRNGSSVIAFRLPEAGFAHFQIVASHSDSPCFKLKPEATRASVGYALLNVE